MKPYRQLVHCNAPASDSILLASHSNLFTGLFYSLRNQHLLDEYISLVAVLCEPLIIALVNIRFNPDLALIPNRVYAYITIAVLSLTLIGVIWLLCSGQKSSLA